jgi:hypothetical protein
MPDGTSIGQANRSRRSQGPGVADSPSRPLARRAHCAVYALGAVLLVAALVLAALWAMEAPIRAARAYAEELLSTAAATSGEGRDAAIWSQPEGPTAEERANVSRRLSGRGWTIVGAIADGTTALPTTVILLRVGRSGSETGELHTLEVCRIDDGWTVLPQGSTITRGP